MSSLWQQDSSENGNLSGRKMNGEGTGIGAPTPALAGFLGKSEDRNASPGNCPWCLAKGQTNALRFYAVNLKETVLLCTNPVCLYPLVSRSLEEVRASLSKGGCKRSISSLPDISDESCPPKRPREANMDVLSDVSEPCDAEVNDATLPDDTVKTETFTDQQSAPAETISIDKTEEQPASIEDFKEQPISLDATEEQPISIDHTEEQPVSIIHTEEQPIILDLIEVKPISVVHTEERPMSIDHTEEQHISIDNAEEQPVSIVHTEEQPIILDLIEVKPISVVHTEERPMSIVHAEEQPMSVDHTEEQHISIDNAEEQPVSIVHIEEQPIILELVEVKPISVVHTEERPMSIDHIEEKPMSINHIEEKPMSFDHTMEKHMSIDQTEEQPVSIDATEEQQPEELPAATDEDVDLCERKDDCVSSTQDETEEVLESSSELVPVHPELFWKNEENMCWLDAMLVMLVHCRTIRETPCQGIKLSDKLATVPCNDSVVWKLCWTYDKTCAYLKAKIKQSEDNVLRVPAGVLDEAERRLSALRLSVFKLLQPTLKCEIGQQETPVFALPLLLRSDKWAQDIFQHTIRWEFKCTCCDFTVAESVEKTLTTLTCIVKDWHPLKANHRTQCNKCEHKNQRRKLVLEKLSSVFALHFVEGLPRKDLTKYEFTFQGLHYSVSTIIQYNKHLQHFVTWVRQSNGLWLELDDLKHPYSPTHKRLPFPSSEFHILFWETDSFKKEHSEVCLPTAPPVVLNAPDENPLKLSDSVADDTCVISALTVEDTTASSIADTSIGSTTLLDTFEGLTHKDIVTLTLVNSESTENEPRPMRPGFVPAPRHCPFVASNLLSGIPKTVSRLSTPPIPQKSSLVNKPEVAAPAAVSKTHLPPTSLFQHNPSFQSTPIRPPPLPPPAPKPKPSLKYDKNEDLLVKPADMFGGFKTKKLASSQPKQVSPPGGLNPSVKKTAEQQPISTTDALRLKLMKKLKAKKKKLAKLNQLLGNGGESVAKPDSTALSSPYSVTSSTTTYDSFDDQFLADLLSPATTVSNLSPDSTGLLEMLNNGQNGETGIVGGQQNPAVATLAPGATLTCSSSTISPLDEYMQSGMCHTALENADFNSLDLFF
ncbi:SUMO-specific isopeptidase USPL1 [Danio aesculapii]|uniref:SUMO-specific isopeptidase USPL1 n=1 Tax=Danio aesculapii TaxID=1142201 RepID=UPI0024C06F96|nr:SUMO-specific isopeptidase USPL1 [Danio aesculapii]